MEGEGLKEFAAPDEAPWQEKRRPGRPLGAKDSYPRKVPKRNAMAAALRIRIPDWVKDRLEAAAQRRAQNASILVRQALVEKVQEWDAADGVEAAG